MHTNSCCAGFVRSLNTIVYGYFSVPQDQQEMRRLHEALQDFMTALKRVFRDQIFVMTGLSNRTQNVINHVNQPL